MAWAISSRLPAAFRIIVWILGVLVVVFCINSFVFRLYRVVGPSMEPTLNTGDVLFINKFGRTLANIGGKQLVPDRGALVVFKNPLRDRGENEEFIVKRVIGLPGERVVVQHGHITVFTQDHSEGFNPDDGMHGPKQPTSGDVDRIVPEGELFVAGDNRESQYSIDSRNGLSTIPLEYIEGVVSFRLLPLW